jgi:hypothetical protein
MAGRRLFRSEEPLPSDGPARVARSRPAAATTAIADRVLSLQATAGNAAVAGLLPQVRRAGPTSAARSPVGTLQRDKDKPKVAPTKKVPAPPKEPWFVTEARSKLATLFPGDKLIDHVKIAGMSSLKAVLSGSDFAAWTQSVTEIYVADPLKSLKKAAKAAKQPELADRAHQEMFLTYVVHHEVEHVRQFDKVGQPKTWLDMIRDERDAYGADVVWLDTTAAKGLIPNDVFRDLLKTSSTISRDACQKKFDEAVKEPKKNGEAVLRKWMIGEELLPANAPAKAPDIYK